ncbi:hypothetical protein CTTA_3895 [Comamonas testosteroni]|uniref:Uncharacterized protein n=1 Tax=Comamonas testosteroni TaxID=285 RepID=A0A5A7MHE0_COMTE|nr:hypothetical protein CTTA_3895 [Comamonas testosteroni]
MRDQLGDDHQTHAHKHAQHSDSDADPYAPQVTKHGLLDDMRDDRQWHQREHGADRSAQASKHQAPANRREYPGDRLRGSGSNCKRFRGRHSIWKKAISHKDANEKLYEN